MASGNRQIEIIFSIMKDSGMMSDKSHNFVANPLASAREVRYRDRQ
jgi:hypothetical protein